MEHKPLVRWRRFRNLDIGHLFHTIIFRTKEVEGYELMIEDMGPLSDALFNLKYYIENREDVKFKCQKITINSTKAEKL